jgi:hypothetical protein
MAQPGGLATSREGDANLGMKILKKLLKNLKISRGLNAIV